MVVRIDVSFAMCIRLPEITLRALQNNHYGKRFTNTSATQNGTQLIPRLLFMAAILRAWKKNIRLNF
jgi:hypothetical protein